MWTELKTEEELSDFMRLVCGFHDSVLKELSYVSGAYVDENLNMYPLNDKACLRVLIQRQDETMPTGAGVFRLAGAAALPDRSFLYQRDSGRCPVPPERACLLV